MKQRLLIMNGQRVFQAEQNGEWNTLNVQKAGDVKAGIYNLHVAKEAEKGRKYVGFILHADDEYVYQQDGKSVIRHARAAFDTVPSYGTLKSISYEHDRAMVATATHKLGRTLTQ
jgi:hypothetical protein